MEAGQEKVERSRLGMPSCLSKYRCFRVRISILTMKMISGTWRPLEDDPGCQPGTYREVTFRYAFIYV